MFAEHGTITDRISRELCVQKYTKMEVVVKVSQGDLLGRKGYEQCKEDVLLPSHLWVQKIPMNSITWGGGGWVSWLPLSVPTTQSAFIEWQSTIHSPPPPLQVLGSKRKNNH